MKRPASGLAGVTASVALIVLAAPPWNLHVLALVALVPLGLAIGNGPTSRATFLAFLTGTVAHFGVCIWWPSTLQRFLDLPVASSIVAAVLLSAYQGLPLALAASVSQGLHHRFKASDGPARVLACRLLTAPLLLAASEVLLPFPFKAYLAILVWQVRPLVQLAEWGGPAAVSALLVAINLTVSIWLLAWRERRRPQLSARIALVVIGMVIVSGQVRIHQVERQRVDAPVLRAGLLQPNFPAMTVLERQRRGHQLVRSLRDSTAELARRGAELIVLPESSWPYIRVSPLEREWPPHHPWHLPRPSGGRVLFGALTGTASDLTPDGNDFGGGSVWNSAFLIGADGRVAGRHDKRRLVPLAESEPLAATRLATLAGGAMPERPPVRSGVASRLLRDGDMRLAVMICAEDLDRGLVGDLASGGANLLIGLANDAWFGASAAAEQHFALATFRAIETRRDFLRVSLTGHSGLIDATGRVHELGPLVIPDGTERPTLLVYDVRLM